MDNARTTQLPSPTLPTLPGQTLRISVLYMDQNLSSHIQIPNFGFMIFQRWIEFHFSYLIGSLCRQSRRWCWRRWCVCPPSVTMYNKTWSRLLIERSQCWITRVRLQVEARRWDDSIECLKETVLIPSCGCRKLLLNIAPNIFAVVQIFLPVCAAGCWRVRAAAQPPQSQRLAS